MYVPGNPPAEYSKQFISNELRKLAQAIAAPSSISINLIQLNVAPTRPQEDTVYNADGTNWNPGSGAGFYLYLSGSYTKL